LSYAKCIHVDRPAKFSLFLQRSAVIVITLSRHPLQLQLNIPVNVVRIHQCDTTRPQDSAITPP